MPQMDAQKTAQGLCERARRAWSVLCVAPSEQKDRFLRGLAQLLRQHGDDVVAASQVDVKLARDAGIGGALLDRLLLTTDRVLALARAVDEIAALPDPVGAMEQLAPRPNGLLVGRMRVPLGVILMVYEARPNVTVEAAALALKSGNTVLLRGGKEAIHANRVLARWVAQALKDAGLPEDAAQLVEDPDRSVLAALLPRRGDIDLCIPRGGVELIKRVAAEARMPVVEHFQGICHVYVDASASLDMALDIVRNGKVQRPGVCNATECVLVHRDVAAAFLPRLVKELAPLNVEMRGCARSVAVAPSMKPAVEADWDTEFLDLVLAVKVVDDAPDAMRFIAQHGSRHTEAIVTSNHALAMEFLKSVDASCVLVNASTRFNDGNELGLGAEMGISTTKLHAYGPMGLNELTTRKWVVLGNGEVRGEPRRSR